MPQRSLVDETELTVNSWIAPRVLISSTVIEGGGEIAAEAAAISEGTPDRHNSQRIKANFLKK